MTLLELTLQVAGWQAAAAAQLAMPVWGHSSAGASGGWAKGTGYAGGDGMYGDLSQPGDKHSRDAATARQQVSDAHIQRSITAICNCVELATGTYTDAVSTTPTT